MFCLQWEGRNCCILSPSTVVIFTIPTFSRQLIRKVGGLLVTHYSSNLGIWDHCQQCCIYILIHKPCYKSINQTSLQQGHSLPYCHFINCLEKCWRTAGAPARAQQYYNRSSLILEDMIFILVTAVDIPRGSDSVYWNEETVRNLVLSENLVTSFRELLGCQWICFMYSVWLFKTSNGDEILKADWGVSF